MPVQLKVQLVSVAEDGSERAEELLVLTKEHERLEQLGLTLAEGSSSSARSSGEDVRDLPLYLNPQSEHVLDWFHRAPRGAVYPSGLRDPPPGRRSGWEKLRAVRPGGCQVGQEQP